MRRSSPTPGLPRIGEDHLPRQAHADHLVVDDVRRHADQREVLAALADRLVRRRMGDEMGEALEGDGIAIVEVFGDSLGQALELGHDALSFGQMSKNTVSFSPCR